MMIHKLYCYVDETGQDTGAELFLVAVVLKEMAGLDSLEKNLRKLKRKLARSSANGRK